MHNCLLYVRFFMIRENKIRSLILITIYVGTNRREKAQLYYILKSFAYKLSEMNSWLYYHLIIFHT